MEPQPHLAESCIDYIGHELEIRFHAKFLAWTQVVDGISQEYPDVDEVVGLKVKIVPTDFFSQRNVSMRGFRGRIVDGSNRFTNFYAVAVPAVSGADFNFTDTQCPDWRIWLSHNELPAPTLAFQQFRGIDMVAGFGTICQPSDHDGYQA
jgi:hypothetical protein